MDRRHSSMALAPAVVSPPRDRARSIDRRHSTQVVVPNENSEVADSWSFRSGSNDGSKSALDQRWGALHRQVSNLTADRSSKDDASAHGSSFGSGISSPVASKQFSRQISGDSDSDIETFAVGRPEEWRLWLVSTPEARRSFDLAQRRMEDLLEKLSAGKVSGGKGFQIQEKTIDQYFCAGSKCAPKVTTKSGRIETEVKMLQGISERGTEFWERNSRAEISSYTKLPWVALQKDRARCKTAKAVIGTRLEGLRAMETAEVKVFDRSVYPGARGGMQRLKNNQYLTIALEGTPDAIGSALIELRLDDLAPHALRNPDGSGLYRNNVSYSRFLVVEADNNTPSNMRTEEALRALERRPSQQGSPEDRALERRKSIEILAERLEKQNGDRLEEEIEELEELQVITKSATASLPMQRSLQSIKESAELPAVKFDTWREAVSAVMIDSSLWSRSRAPDGDLNDAGPELMAAMLGEMQALRSQNRQLLERNTSMQAETEASRVNLKHTVNGLSKKVCEFQAMLQRSEMDQGVVEDSLQLRRTSVSLSEDIASLAAAYGSPPTFKSVIADITGVSREATLQGLISRVGAGTGSPIPNGVMQASSRGSSRSPSPSPPTPSMRDQRLGNRIDALIGPKSPSTLRPLAYEVAHLKLRSPGVPTSSYGREDGLDRVRSSNPTAKKPLERSFDNLRQTMDRTAVQQGGIITRVGARRGSQLTELQGLRSKLFE